MGRLPGYLSPSTGPKFTKVPDGPGASSRSPVAGWAQFVAYTLSCEFLPDLSENLPTSGDRAPGWSGFHADDGDIGTSSTGLNTKQLTTFVCDDLGWALGVVSDGSAGQNGDIRKQPVISKASHPMDPVMPPVTAELRSAAELKTEHLNAEIANGRPSGMANISTFPQDGRTGSAYGDWALYTDGPSRTPECELGVQACRRVTEVKHGSISMLVTMAREPAEHSLLMHLFCKYSLGFGEGMPSPGNHGVKPPFLLGWRSSAWTPPLQTGAGNGDGALYMPTDLNTANKEREMSVNRQATLSVLRCVVGWPCCACRCMSWSPDWHPQSSECRTDVCMRCESYSGSEPFGCIGVCAMVVQEKRRLSGAERAEVVGALRSLPGSESASSTSPTDYGHPAWLDNCNDIYLDIGSNIGVQVRKLFEPHKYPKAKLLPVFSRIFGETRGTGVCALGMEPNPKHSARLLELEKTYNARGFKTHFYNFAAWKEEGHMKFMTTYKGDQARESWGARIVKQVVQVRTIDLSDFILSLPKGRVKLMKLDIEGAEYETLAHALPQHVLCTGAIPETFVEAHGQGDITTWHGPRSAVEIRKRIKDHRCPADQSPSKVLFIDDESYLHDVDSNFTGSQ